MSKQTKPPLGVLITGASTGIGRACARLLAGRGYAVLAGVRNEMDAQSIVAEAGAAAKGGGSLAPVRIDVTDAGSIAAAAEAVRNAFSGKLFALINNAGVVVAGPVEYVSLADWRRQFEINFFGQIAVTQAMLPMLREYQRGSRRDGGGSGDVTQGDAARGEGASASLSASASPSARIVFVSSIAGRVSQPIVGPYCASKFALEAMADALRIELREQGIGVTLIEPGAIDTPIWKKGQNAFAALPADHPAHKEYGPLVRGLSIGAAKAGARAVSADVVAGVIAKALIRKRAPARRLVGRDAKLGAVAKWILPSGAIDYFLDTALRREGSNVDSDEGKDE